MKRNVIGTSLLVAGLVAGSFLAGSLMFKDGGSAASGQNTGFTGSIATPTATAKPPTATATPKVVITPAVTPSDVTGNGGDTTGSGTAGGTAGGGNSGGAVILPAITPEPPVVTPEPPVITPEPPVVTPEPPVVTPEPPVITPEPPVVTPEPPVVTPEPEINETPFVTAMTPADEANRQPLNTTIDLTFSEPMDEASTEAAFSINPALAGTFSWDAEGMVMTFTPNVGFDYNTKVQWQLGGSAQDATGLAMGEDVNGSFWVLRQKTINLYSQPGRDGFVYAPSADALDKVITEGFAGHNSLKVGSWYRGFLSFDLSKLPAETVEIMSAELVIHQRAHHAQAYTAETGSLWVVSLPYVDLDASDYAKAPLQLCIQTCVPSAFLLSDSAADGWKSADLSFFVQRDWENSKGDMGSLVLPGGNERLTQFRLQFQNENQGAGPDVWAEFHSGEAGGMAARLEVTFVY